MEKQSLISEKRLQAKVGTRQVVIIDSVEGETAIARSSSSAPEIDGVVHVTVDDYDIEAGDFIEVDITAADEHDLYGVVVGE